MRKLFILNKQRSKAHTFYLLFILLIFLLSGCGDGSDDSFSARPAETGSAIFTVAWHNTSVIEASENGLITAQPEPVDCTLVKNIICEVRDESDGPLTSKTFTDCYAGGGTIEGIPIGTNRKFVILAEDADGLILNHGEVSGITITAGQTTNVGTIDTYPYTPAGVSATAISSSQINLSWDATDDVGLTGYNIYRDGSLLKSVTSTSTSDTGLSPSTPYCYTVSAFDAAGNESGKSNTKTFTTPACPKQEQAQVSSLVSTGAVLWFNVVIALIVAGIVTYFLLRKRANY